MSEGHKIVVPIPGSARRIGLENMGDPRKPNGSTKQLYSDGYLTAGTPLCHIITLSPNLNQITYQTGDQLHLGGGQPELINTDLVKKLITLKNLEAHYIDAADQQHLCLDRASLSIERHAQQGQTHALTSQNTPAI